MNRVGIVAWATFGLSTALAGGAAFLMPASERAPSNAFPLVAAISFPLVGALVAMRHPRNVLGWLFLAAGVAEGAGVFANRYAHRGLLIDPGSLPGAGAMAWLGSWLWIVGFAVVVSLAPLLFPNGKPPSPRWRPIVALALCGILLVVVASALIWPYRGVRLLGTDEISEARLANTLGAVGVGAVLLSAPASLAGLFLRFRRSRGLERLQLKWFSYGSALSLILVLVSWIVEPAGLLLLFAIPLIPTAAAIAILRYRLYDIDIVINRSLVYGSLTAVVFGASVGAVALFDVQANRSSTRDLGPALLVSVLVVVFLQPIRTRAQRAVNRMMYGLRDDPYAAISRVTVRLEAASRPGDALQGIVESVTESLRLPYAAIELKRNGAKPELLAACGMPAAEVQPVPLVYQGQTVGTLLVSPRAGNQPLSGADRRLLSDLARPTGVAVHALQLARDLQQARAQLVAAREEERRRLRRDLHDGLGPTLAGIALELDATGNIAAADPVAAKTRLRDLGARTQAAIFEIRRLVDGLRPATLDELGLVGTLREQATRFGNLVVIVQQAGSLESLPAATEVAAYRIALESITNAARHSNATQCTVRLALRDELQIEIVDNGTGVPDRFRPGVGLSSIRERAEEIGGTCIVERADGGGTRVLATLPVDPR